MRPLLFILIIITLFWCPVVSCKRSVETVAQTQTLTLADLKFPIIENEETSLGEVIFPRIQNDAIKANRVKEKIVVPALQPIDSFTAEIKDWYNDFRQRNPISFDSFFFKFRPHANITFDTNGRQVIRKNSGQFGIHIIYRYDSMGYLILQNGGSCIPRFYRFYSIFIQQQRRLYLYKYDVYNLLHATDSSAANPAADLIKTLISELTIFDFDTAGYLSEMKSGYGQPSDEYYHLYDWKFLYDSKHRLHSIERHNTWSGRARDNNDRQPASGYERLPDHSIANYFYTGNRLDSIVTDMYYYLDPMINRTLRVYFNEQGLPVKQAHQNYKSKMGGSVTLYEYEYYK